MNEVLSMTFDDLKTKNAFWTANEITQQPDCWLETINLVNEMKNDLSKWLNKFYGLSNSRIILTGAGTSAYIGDAVAPYIQKRKQIQVESISTTDIVSSPNSCFINEKPTLLVSFARSGNSPESLAAIELCDQLVENSFHLIFTCNPQSILTDELKNSANCFFVLLPEKTHDRSFAMTSSFTCMAVASAYALSDYKDSEHVETVSFIAKSVIEQHIKILNKSLNDTKKIVFLGSGCLNGFAKEASLKMLELTAGKLHCAFETPLGFRHGPKSIVDSQTEIYILESANPYTKRYDHDLYNELVGDKTAYSVNLMSDFIDFDLKGIPDVYNGLVYIVLCQILAFFKSTGFGLSPDNPCPSGEVNRVVQGVTIHNYKETNS